MNDLIELVQTNPGNTAIVAAILGLVASYVPAVKQFAPVIHTLMTKPSTTPRPQPEPIPLAPTTDPPSPTISPARDAVGKLLDVIEYCRSRGDQATAEALAGLLPKVATPTPATL